tara:strand:+ start:3364 stop:3582 length:219 start_codon:yes stop_codon:yes gene_type:complete
MDDTERPYKRRLTVKRIQGNRNEATPLYLSANRLLRYDCYPGTIFHGLFDIFYVVEFGNDVNTRSMTTKISV